MVEEGHLIEYTKYGEHFYGTGKDALGPYKVMVIETHGLKQLILNEVEPLYVCAIIAPEQDRLARMKERGDSPETILNRIKLDEELFSDVARYAHCIVFNNEDGNELVNLHKAVEELAIEYGNFIL